MRVLQSGIYNNFLQDQASAKEKIDSLTSQISSGKKIQNAYEDSSVYIDTLRLDSEINSFQGIQNRTEKSKVITDSSDTAMNDMDVTLIDFKTKLIQAANGTMNEDNLRSSAQELKQMKEHLMTLANSSINGEYLFSGTAVNVKPIDELGHYHGNDKPLMTQISESATAPYSVDGKSLFMTFDENIKKSVSTNVHLQNQTTADTIKSDDTVYDLLGNHADGYFYLAGVKHDGEAFKSKIALPETDKMTDLLGKIEDAYGAGTVVASLSDDGTIMIDDLQSGNSKLDFQMTASNVDNNDLSAIASGDKIAFTTTTEAVDDRASFNKKGNILTGNVPLLADDGFAAKSTKLRDIAAQSLDGKQFSMDITTVNGTNKTIQLDLSAQSSFTVDGYSYHIFNADDTAPVNTDADTMTLGQLDNVIAMVMSETLPASDDKAGFDTAVKDAKNLVDVGINSNGEIQIEDKSGFNNAIAFSLYDQDTNDYSVSSGSLSFMGNSAVVVENPKIDFFKDLDTIIEAVEGSITGINASGVNPKNPGLQSALARIDTLSNHISKMHTKIGAMSNNLQAANERASTLELNVTALKSKVADVDVAEAVVQYQQVSLNYQAMMSTIAKVNSLTLLNYLK